MTEDWQIDIDDDGAQVAVCPQCASANVGHRDSGRLVCLDCDHVEGTKYQSVSHGPYEPPELVPVAAHEDDWS